MSVRIASITLYFNAPLHIIHAETVREKIRKMFGFSVLALR
jgi:hypothetical protein